MAADALDAAGPLHAPDFLRDDESPVSVLVDCERVRWIGVNRSGADLLERVRAHPGATASECGAGEAARFLRDAARRGFLANAPFPPVVRRNRRESMEPDRLHEFWVVTNDHCNLRCRHCYTIDRVKQGRTGMPGPALKAIVDDARGLGAEVFYFTGGEPTLRDDIADLAGHVLARSKLILFTNGLTLGDELMSVLAAGRDRLVVQISIEGPDEATNARLRGRGSFDKALQGVRRCLERGVRVGVSTTPNGASKDAIELLTAQLAELEVGGRRVEYHHLILLLDRGGARDHADVRALAEADLDRILDRSLAAIRRARAGWSGGRLQLTNDKIFHALATNGPAKDFCGSGYTILGVSADGQLLPCAACMDDDRFFLGDLLEPDLSYRSGRLEEMWRTSPAVERLRRFSLAPADGGRVRDLRYFHGGGCWKNMSDAPDSGADFFDAHPFARFYERRMMDAIRAAAAGGRGAPVQEDRPELVSFMHAARIACAGARKTRGSGEVDQGHCICFA